MLFKHDYPEADVLELDDHSNDDVWSENLDNILSRNAYENITLYGSRNSFLSCYSGKYPTEIYQDTISISATDIRKKIARPRNVTSDFLKGIIYVAENKYPIVYQTVDVCIFNNNGEFLLGRKNGMKTWCFIGGFVDVKDDSLEDAAEREFTEEVKNIRINKLTYVGSLKIDDWRYRGTSDCVMTSVFVGYLPHDQSSIVPEAGDD